MSLIIIVCLFGAVDEARILVVLPLHGLKSHYIVYEPLLKRELRKSEVFIFQYWARSHSYCVRIPFLFLRGIKRRKKLIHEGHEKSTLPPIL
ncbi:hypothetical protein ALC62_04220 [Cyphomyrmex costatus]|uniref:Uncharacterized protein n=1 Tax=Cyphomyrmex costatus TaxID=456900 RepID=A0A195CVY1_9HYME|nr:hypothetical protein ALC62_04220 [Cyphomyrmex costatus]